MLVIGGDSVKEEAAAKSNTSGGWATETVVEVAAVVLARMGESSGESGCWHKGNTDIYSGGNSNGGCGNSDDDIDSSDGTNVGGGCSDGGSVGHHFITHI